MSNTELTTDFNDVGNFLAAKANDAAVRKAGGILFDAFGSLSLALTAACLLIGLSVAFAAPNIDLVDFWQTAVTAGY
jgi:hypothetical protein